MDLANVFKILHIFPFLMSICRCQISDVCMGTVLPQNVRVERVPLWRPILNFASGPRLLLDDMF